MTRPRRRGATAPSASRLLGADPVAALRGGDAVSSSVLQVILERARSGSRSGARTDGYRVALAIEGGGMRGALTAGMCIVLEASGLVNAFDGIYGVSAGALNACATATGQAALSATHYEDAARRRVINPMRPLLGRPVIDFDLLFEDVIAARKPLSFEALGRGPEFRSLAISLETMSLRVLGDFANADELLQAVRASAALPRLGGNAPRFRGEPMTDGALLEPIPYETARAEGASHVLVLRSRPAGYRKPAYSGLGNAFGVHDRRELAELIRAGNGIYNRQAAWLEHGCRHTSEDAHLFQVAVPENPRGVSRLRADPRAIAEAVRLGARTMATAVLAEPIDLCWQPVVFRTTAGEAAGSRALAKLPRGRVATAIGAQTAQ